MCNVSIDSMRIPMDCFWLHIWVSFILIKFVYLDRNQFEYRGCFTDKEEYGLHSRGFFLAENMSANICYIMCNTGHVIRNFFATENGDQCFCGSTIGLRKLDKGKQEESNCETPCVSNENEMCGSINKASVYVFETDKQQIDLAYTTQMNLHSCHYGSGMKDIYVNSLERSEYCDELDDATLSNTQHCNGEFYCFNSSKEFRNITEEFHSLRKYMKISYSCLGYPNASVGSLHSINASIVGGVFGAFILTVCIVFLTLCLVKRSCSNRKKKRRPYTTARNGSKIQDKALLVMLSSNNPSSPGYESLQLNHTEFFEYAQTMVTAEQDLTDDEVINDHCSKQSANENNEVNHYESVEAANYSQYDKGSPRNQRSFQSLNSSESVLNKSLFNSSNKIDELLPGKYITSESTIENPYDTIDPQETGFTRSESDNSINIKIDKNAGSEYPTQKDSKGNTYTMINSKESEFYRSSSDISNSQLDQIVHNQCQTQMESTGNAYAELDPKETGFYRRKSDNSKSQLDEIFHGQKQTEMESTGNAYVVLDPKEIGLYGRKSDNNNSQLEKIINGGDPIQRESTCNAYAILDPKETGFNRSNSLDNALEKVIPGDDLYQKDHSTVNPYYILNPKETGFSRSEVENCEALE
ncbi:uncharacterized protein LOC134725241 isoform X2 [Mytilus trossulus]|uniref:uncharacterized protein LOC134725241 isoform X2 n=1 Tax=Mytilus trossulus TaxID=6551 RepID=UPI003006A000